MVATEVWVPSSVISSQRPPSRGLHQDLLDRLLADAKVVGPPARQTAGKDVERVRNRCVDANFFANGCYDDRLVHSFTPSSLVGFFCLQLKGLQRIAPKAVEPFAQFHQALPPKRIDPAHALAALLDQAGVFQNL